MTPLTPHPNLTDARLQLHYAIQFMAMTGHALSLSQPDHSHSSLDWLPEQGWFSSQRIEGPTPFRVTLDPVSLTLRVVGSQGEKIAALELIGQTLDQGLSWLQSVLSPLGTAVEKLQFLSYPPDDFPDHAVAHGAAFAPGDAAARQQLASYYGLTHDCLSQWVKEMAGASAIHIWPHHFDMATLVTLPETRNGQALTIGIGLSPGDRSYDQPYWYVSPYPDPPTDPLPSLEGGGHWHTQHWVGAVLTASTLIPGTVPALIAQINAFITSAVNASAELLGSQARIRDMPTSAWQITLIQRAANAWINGDADAFAELFWADGEFMVPGNCWIGPVAIRAVAANFAAAYAPIKIEIQRILTMANQAMVEWHWQETEIETGKQSNAADAIVIDFQNRRIRRWREYIDTQSCMSLPE
ncbi:nuclear transport factor 2 family protein [Lyngbya confervoides]|uniref:SgcJ/EcaC family oxidoreductase n=1 Tax=Lyngbya confervoides BDU141951 TaxID=1574623 RepID=A0ABD4SY20_9CYAN|nr:SgcJ/EcaC family oxidoreductase [Lyngbya confervoides]MCM1981223.1 SgcJ/EcaC family oxidoreductase [Lyngbya confervoides BDU141951]